MKTSSIYQCFLGAGVFLMAGVVTSCAAVSSDESLGPLDAEVGESGEASCAAPTVGAGFNLASSAVGVAIYKSSAGFMTVVNLKNATALSLTGTVVNGKIQKKATSTFWNDAVSRNTNTRSVKAVVGGTFFSLISNPTDVAFGLKVAGSLISYGYASPGMGAPEFPNQTKLFTFNNTAGLNRAWIGAYNLDSFTKSPDVVGALDVVASKSPMLTTGRTFVGVRDDDCDGQYEMILVYTSPASTQAAASSALASFGVGSGSQAMLDGSGSSFLVSNQGPLVPSSDNRLIPHAIAFYSGH